MKLVVFSKTGEKQTVECESFEFDSGFLKLINPTGSTATEFYISLGSITMLENFGPRQAVTKKTKKDK